MGQSRYSVEREERVGMLCLGYSEYYVVQKHCEPAWIVGVHLFDRETNQVWACLGNGAREEFWG